MMTLEQVLAANFGLATDGNEGSALSGIMKEVVENNIAERRKKVLGALAQVLNQGQEQIDETVATLRKVRAEESKLASKVKLLQSTYDHFKKTGNPLPYYKATNQESAINGFFDKIGLDREDFPANHEIWKTA